MKDRIAFTGLALMIWAFFWLLGFWGQKVLNRGMKPRDYSLVGLGAWSYLFGVRPSTERVYLRPATFQLVGILLVLVGIPAVWLGGTKTFNVVFVVLFGGWFSSGFAFGITDIVMKIKHGKDHDQDRQ